MKGTTCPICNLDPLTEDFWTFVKGRELRCRGCNGLFQVHVTKSQLVHILHILALLLIGPVMNLGWLALLLLALGMVASNIFFLAFLVPLVPVQEKQRTGPDAKPISLRQSPLLWVGIPVLLFVFYKYFKFGI